MNIRRVTKKFDGVILKSTNVTNVTMGCHKKSMSTEHEEEGGGLA